MNFRILFISFLQYLLINMIFVWSTTANAAPSLYAAGSVNLAIRLADGSTIVAGNFTTVDGVPRPGLAKLTPMGQLDANWAPPSISSNVAAQIVALAVSPDGSALYVATASNVLKVAANGVGTSTPNFFVGATGSVDGGSSGIRTIGVDSSGLLYVAGAFAYINSQQRGGIARLHADGTIDGTWTTPISGAVNTIAIDTNGGYLYLGGSFVGIGDQTHLRVGRLQLSDGSSDDTWNPLITSSGSIVSVQRLLVIPGADAVVFVGKFTEVNGTPRSGVAKVSTSSSALDGSWIPSLAGYDVGAIAVRNGFVYFGGPQICCGTGFLKRADAESGVIDNVWLPLFSKPVAAMTFDDTGNVTAFGGFDYVNNQPMFAASVISNAGSVSDVLPDFEVEGAITATASEATGSLLLAGNFQKVDQQYHAGLFRLKADVTIDPSFHAPRFEGGGISPLALLTVAADSNTGLIYVGGTFDRVAGFPHLGTVRLGANGAIDSSWTPAVTNGAITGWVQAIALDQGSIYLGGQFNAVNGSSRSNFAKLTAAGSLDPQSIPTNGFVSRIAVKDNSIFLLGNFNQVGGYSRFHVAKIWRATGALDDMWNPNFDWLVTLTNVYDLKVMASDVFITERSSIPYLGGVMVVGEIVRIDDLGFAQPIARFDLPVFALQPAIDGESLIAAGSFYYQYAIENAFDQTAHPGGFAQISVQPGTSGLAEAWSPQIGANDEAGLAILGNKLVIAGGMTKTSSVPRRGVTLIDFPIGDYLFRDAFD